MYKVIALFLILLPICSAFAGLPEFNKEQLPPLQADVDPNCHNVPGFRQCYSDFLKQLGITDITQSFAGGLSHAYDNGSRAGMESLHSTFDSFDYCLTKQQLHSCMNMATLQGFGISPENANRNVIDYMFGVYVYLTAYQVYYEKFGCIDFDSKNFNYTNSTEGVACDNAGNQINQNPSCSNFENYFRTCLPFYNKQCQNNDVGAFYCNMFYLTTTWDKNGWTQFSQCNNVCPRAGKPCSPSPPSGGSNGGAIKSEAFHTVFFLTSILFVTRLFFK